MEHQPVWNDGTGPGIMPCEQADTDSPLIGVGSLVGLMDNQVILF